MTACFATSASEALRLLQHALMLHCLSAAAHLPNEGGKRRGWATKHDVMHFMDADV